MRCEVGCSCGRHRSSDRQRAAVAAANRLRKIDASCSVVGCGKKVCAKGLCRPHYNKQWRNAVPKNLPFTVYQWEWDDPRIRSIIEAQADKSGAVRVGARKCEVSPVSSAESRSFLDENHLQGYTHGSVRYGLRHKGELVAVMTFGVPREQKKDDPIQWELIRFCVKKRYLVPGGASRLFAHFVREHDPQSIVSYSDNAKATGEMYPILGFSYVNTSAPGYVWWNGKQARRRYECMAYKLKERYAGEIPGIETMSEAAIMGTLGYTKIPNEGNKVWVWRKD